MSTDHSDDPQEPSSQGDVAFSIAIGDVIIAPEERLEFRSHRALRNASTRSLRDIERTLSFAPWWDIRAIGNRDLASYDTDCGIYACIPIVLTRLLSHESSKHRITCQVCGSALYSALERTYALGLTLN